MAEIDPAIFSPENYQAATGNLTIWSHLLDVDRKSREIHRAVNIGNWETGLPLDPSGVLNLSKGKIALVYHTTTDAIPRAYSNLINNMNGQIKFVRQYDRTGHEELEVPAFGQFKTIEHDILIRVKFHPASLSQLANFMLSYFYEEAAQSKHPTGYGIGIGYLTGDPNKRKQQLVRPGVNIAYTGINQFSSRNYKKAMLRFNPKQFATTIQKRAGGWDTLLAVAIRALWRAIDHPSWSLSKCITQLDPEASAYDNIALASAGLINASFSGFGDQIGENFTLTENWVDIIAPYLPWPFALAFKNLPVSLLFKNQRIFKLWLGLNTVISIVVKAKQCLTAEMTIQEMSSYLETAVSMFNACLVPDYENTGTATDVFLVPAAMHSKVKGLPVPALITTDPKSECTWFAGYAQAIDGPKMSATMGRAEGAPPDLVDYGTVHAHRDGLMYIKTIDKKVVAELNLYERQDKYWTVSGLGFIATYLMYNSTNGTKLLSDDSFMGLETGLVDIKNNKMRDYKVDELWDTYFWALDINGIKSGPALPKDPSDHNALEETANDKRRGSIKDRTGDIGSPEGKVTHQETTVVKTENGVPRADVNIIDEIGVKEPVPEEE